MRENTFSISYKTDPATNSGRLLSCCPTEENGAGAIGAALLASAHTGSVTAAYAEEHIHYFEQKRGSIMKRIIALFWRQFLAQRCSVAVDKRRRFLRQRRILPAARATGKRS